MRCPRMVTLGDNPECEAVSDAQDTSVDESTTRTTGLSATTNRSELGATRRAAAPRPRAPCSESVHEALPSLTLNSSTHDVVGDATRAMEHQPSTMGTAISAPRRVWRRKVRRRYTTACIVCTRRCRNAARVGATHDKTKACGGGEKVKRRINHPQCAPQSPHHDEFGDARCAADTRLRAQCVLGAAETLPVLALNLIKSACDGGEQAVRRIDHPQWAPRSPHHDEFGDARCAADTRPCTQCMLGAAETPPMLAPNSIKNWVWRWAK